MSGPVSAARADGPRSGFVPTAKPKISAPTSVSERYAAALAVENRKGTAITKAPMPAHAQRAHCARRIMPALRTPEGQGQGLARSSAGAALRGQSEPAE